MEKSSVAFDAERTKYSEFSLPAYHPSVTLHQKIRMLHFKIKLNQVQDPSSCEAPPFFTMESLLKICKRTCSAFLCVHRFFCRDLSSRTNSESLPFYCELCSSSVSCFLALPGSADAGSLRNAPSLPLPAAAPWTETSGLESESSA